MSHGFPPPVLPVIREGNAYPAILPRQKRQDNAATGTYAAAVRALSARMLGFWFRAPIKAFFRTRVDYMGYVRAINPSVQAGEAWSWRMTTPAMLSHAVRQYGWTFIPNQVLPPLIANTVVGAVLYAGYLQTLAVMHPPSSGASKRVYPPPSFSAAYSAGFISGSFASLIAAPVDALQVRFQAHEMTAGKYRNMWLYAFSKTREIGLRGVFAGWSLSFLKDSFGYGIFFGTFEYVKSQCFYRFVSDYYGHYGKLSSSQKAHIDSQSQQDGASVGSNPIIKPHYMLEPSFILLAGIAASIAQQGIQHPLTRIQEVHYGRLLYIDSHPKSFQAASRGKTLKLYASAYRKTWKEVLVLARREFGGGTGSSHSSASAHGINRAALRRWLYADFVRSTLRQAPSTSVGLIVFEVVRRKYATEADVVKIEKDGYDILLP